MQVWSDGLLGPICCIHLSICFPIIPAHIPYIKKLELTKGVNGWFQQVAQIP